MEAVDSKPYNEFGGPFNRTGWLDGYTNVENYVDENNVTEYLAVSRRIYDKLVHKYI